MRLSDYQTKIKTGDVLAWSYTGFSTWYDIQIQLIRIFTRSEYCHVGVAYVQDGQVYVLESVVAGIRKRIITVNDLPVYVLSTGVAWSGEMEFAAMRQMNRPYSKVKAVLSLLYNFKPGGDGFWECAEYVRYILVNGGINIDCLSTPAAVVRWLQENAEATLIEINKA